MLTLLSTGSNQSTD